jgi:hypothetical protein
MGTTLPGNDFHPVLPQSGSLADDETLVLQHRRQVVPLGLGPAGHPRDALAALA